MNLQTSWVRPSSWTQELVWLKGPGVAPSSGGACWSCSAVAQAVSTLWSWCRPLSRCSTTPGSWHYVALVAAISCHRRWLGGWSACMRRFDNPHSFQCAGSRQPHRLWRSRTCRGYMLEWRQRQILHSWRICWSWGSPLTCRCTNSSPRSSRYECPCLLSSLSRLWQSRTYSRMRYTLVSLTVPEGTSHEPGMLRNQPLQWMQRLRAATLVEHSCESYLTGQPHSKVRWRTAWDVIEKSVNRLASFWPWRGSWGSWTH